MDATDLVNSFATAGPSTSAGQYTVTRRPRAGTDGHGRLVAASTSTFTVAASVQPASGRDLLRLPEGRRSIETRRIYTTVELLTGDKNGAFEADLVLINGQQFEVEHAEAWLDSPSGDPEHWKVIAQAATAPVTP